MKRVTLFTMLAALLISGAAIAQPGHGRHGGNGNCDGPGCKQGQGHGKMGQMQRPGVMRMLMLADELELTDKQTADLKAKMEPFQIEKIDLQANLQKAKLRMRTLMAEESPNDAKVLAAIDQVTKLEGDLKKMRYRHHSEVYSMLTDAQKGKLKAMHKEGKGQRGMMPGNGMMKRDGSGPGMGHGMGMRQGSCTGQAHGSCFGMINQWNDDSGDVDETGARMQRIEDILGEDI